MKNQKFIKIAMLMSTSIILVGCQKQNNEYENKTVKVTETTSEYSHPTTIEESAIKTQEKTTIEQTTVASTTEEIIMTDEQVIDYIRNISDNMTESCESITDSVKSGFITVVDFLFYNGEIGGRTFDSLKDDSKSVVLGIYDNISTYIEEKWPIWKEILGEKYEQVRELWNEKKDDLSELWQSGKQKIKTWYEKFRQENQK